MEMDVPARELRIYWKENNMKILHISRSMGQGGAEKIVYQLCRDNKEHEQYVISCGGYYIEELEKIGVKHFMMPDIDKKNPFLMLTSLYKIWKVVKTEKIDVIHSHHRMAAFYAKIISMFGKVKCVYTAHNVFYDKKSVMRFALSNCQIVAVGNGVKKNLVDVYQIPEQKIKVVYNSIKIEKKGTINTTLSEKSRQGKILIGNIGRLTQQKGVDIFIRAISEVLDCFPNVLGVIVGDGEERADLEKLVSDLKLSNNVIFLGYQKNILQIISQLKFVVLSSRYEGLPLLPIETFSQRKTIIASNISGNNEVVTDSVTGLLFEKDDIEGLAGKIKELLKDEKLCEQLERNAQQEYIEKYEYNLFIEGYNAVYRNM